MGRMARSNILIIGLKGLGAEVAKNVILAGVKSVTLYDTEPVTLGDLSAHFYLSEADIGKPRAAACAKSLQDLNPGVLVHVDAGSDLHSKDFIGRFSAVVALDIPLHKVSRGGGTVARRATPRRDATRPCTMPGRDARSFLLFAQHIFLTGLIRLTLHSSFAEPDLHSYVNLT